MNSVPQVKPENEFTVLCELGLDLNVYSTETDRLLYSLINNSHMTTINQSIDHY